MKSQDVLNNELNRLRNWLKETCEDDRVQSRSYISRIGNQKNGNLCFSSLCDTDLRQFREALKVAKKEGSRESLQELRRIVVQIGQSGLLQPVSETEDWLPEHLVQKHRDAFTRELREARKLVHEALTRELPERNRHYTGRSEIAEIEREFWEADTERTPIVVISGMGGLGKSTSAIEYAYCNWQRYDYILWLTAETTSELLNQYADYAKMLDLLPDARLTATKMGAEDGSWEESGDRKELLERSLLAMRKWLEYTSNYLVIFDNLSGQVSLDKFLPDRLGGHILVTTRLSSLVRKNTALIRLNCFTSDQGADFLSKRSKIERSAMDALVELVGGLPLAMELVASALKANKKNPNWYVQKLTEHLKSAANMLIFDADGDRVDPRLYATFMSSFDTLPAAVQDLLCLLAFMGPTPFYEEWLQMGHTNLGETLSGALVREEPLALILDLFSLCDCTHGSYQLHRMIQATIRAALSSDEREIWMHRAVTLLSHILPHLTLATLHYYQGFIPQKNLVPHLLAVCLVQNDMVWTDERMASLLYCIGRYLSEYAMFEEAGICLRRCLEIRRKLYPEGSEALVQTLRAMVGHLIDMERRDEAYEALMETHEMALRVLPKEHALWPEIYAKMAYCLCSRNRMEEAEKFVHLGLECKMESIVPELLSTLAVIRVHQSRFEVTPAIIEGYRRAAHTLFQQAIDAHTKTRNVYRTTEAYCYCSMGRLSASLGQFERSRWEANKSLEIIKQIYDEQHPAYATVLLDFACGRLEEGMRDEAEKAFKVVYEIRKKHYGEENGATQIALTLMGQSLVKREA